MERSTRAAGERRAGTAGAGAAGFADLAAFGFGFARRAQACLFLQAAAVPERPLSRPQFGHACEGGLAFGTAGAGAGTALLTDDFTAAFAFVVVFVFVVFSRLLSPSDEWA